MSTQALMRVDSNAVANLGELQNLGQIFVKSGFFQDAKDAAQAVVKVMAGQELGFGPIASMTGVYIVKGKVSLSANLMAAAIKRTGRYNYRLLEHTTEACVIEFFENGRSVGKSGYTMTEAKAAELTSNPTWKKFPRNMLFARALSNGARWFCPDVFGGPVYTPEELGASVNEEGEVIDVTPEPVAPINPVQAAIDLQAPLKRQPDPMKAEREDLIMTFKQLAHTAGFQTQGEIRAWLADALHVEKGNEKFTDWLHGLGNEGLKMAVQFLQALVEEQQDEPVDAEPVDGPTADAIFGK